MNVSYGIGVTNRYAVFMGDEDADPLDMLSKVKEEPDKKVAGPGTGAGTGGGHAKKASVQPLNSTENRMTKDRNKGASNQMTTSNSIGAANNNLSAKNKDASGGSNQVNRDRGEPGNQNAAPGGNRDRRRGPGDQGSNRTAKEYGNKGEGPYGNKGSENRQSNRPPRQERIVRPSNQVNSTSAGPANNAATNDASGQPVIKDQKDFEERKNRRNREERGPPTFNSEFKDRGDEGYRGSSGRSRGSMGGFRGGRGGRGRGGTFNRGKREYDRQSGSDKTGIKATEKRDGSGAHNWGTVNDELEGQLNPGSEETHDMADRSGDENTFENADNKDEAGAHEEDAKEAEQVEDMTKEMTLEEWKKEQEEKRALPKFNLRKPGEGEDNAQWKKTYVLKKKPDDEDDGEYEEIVVEEEIHKGRNKKVIDIEINFGRDDNRDNRRGRGRGGMRGGRGRGGMEGGRGGGMSEGRGGRGAGRGSFRGRDAKEQAAPKMDNWEEFPSLAAA